MSDNDLYLYFVDDVFEELNGYKFKTADEVYEKINNIKDNLINRVETAFDDIFDDYIEEQNLEWEEDI